MLQSPLNICTLHLDHGEITIPGECSNQKAAHYFLEKTNTTKKLIVWQKKKEKIVLLLFISLGICWKMVITIIKCPQEPASWMLQNFTEISNG